jgi:hypothetical protein
MSQETLWVESNLGILVYRVMLVHGVDACADIHFPGKVDNISRHSGIVIPLGTAIKMLRNKKKWKKLDLFPMDHT